MKFEDIRPFVRSVVHVKQNKSGDEEFVISYDRTVIYGIKGKGKMIFKNEEYDLCRGNIIMCDAGVPYMVLSENELEYMRVNFDYSKNTSVSKSVEMLPVKETEFDPKKIIPDVRLNDGIAFNNTVFVDNMCFTEERFFNMYVEFRRREKYYECKLMSELYSILVNISRRIQDNSINNKFAYLTVSDEIVNYIQLHYNEDLSNDIIAKIFNFTPKHVNKLVKNKTGYPVHKYVIICRISKAIEYLQTSNMSISEICDEIGFNDIAYFSKYFKQLIGVSPSTYRNKKSRYLR